MKGLLDIAFLTLGHDVLLILMMFGGSFLLGFAFRFYMVQPWMKKILAELREYKHKTRVFARRERELEKRLTKKDTEIELLRARRETRHEKGGAEQLMHLVENSQ